MTAHSFDELVAALRSQLTTGALPGEVEGFDPDQIEAAAKFVVTTAHRRRPGEHRIAIEPLASEATRRRMRIAIINDDMPFLVDSIAGAISARDIQIERIIHPVVAVERDAGGLLTKIGGGGRRESMVYLEMDRADARERRDLASDIDAVLVDVRAAVSDWPAMTEALKADAERLGDTEGGALLRWFNQGMMTLLGHFEWRAEDGQGESAVLGIARKPQTAPVLVDASRRMALEWFERGG